jgi:hypothetical protein
VAWLLAQLKPRRGSFNPNGTKQIRPRRKAFGKGAQTVTFDNILVHSILFKFDRFGREPYGKQQSQHSARRSTTAPTRLQGT